MQKIGNTAATHLAKFTYQRVEKLKPPKHIQCHEIMHLEQKQQGVNKKKHKKINSIK